MDSTATARSDFATRLYSKMAGTQAGQNLFLSPFSIRVALAMCAVGARGETRLVMADLIGAPESVCKAVCKAVQKHAEKSVEEECSWELCGNFVGTDPS